MYRKDQMIAAVRACGIDRGDIVMAHVGMSSLRDLPDGVRGQDAMSAFCADALIECVGDDGALAIPSFTYSLGAGEVYDPSSTPCRNIGAFPEFFRKMPGVVRSDDPFLAVAALGSRARELFDGTSRTSYGDGSFFGRFTRMGGKLLCVGVGIRWATIRYHFDEVGGAPFRYLKKFCGAVMRDGAQTPIEWEYSVAPRAPKVDAMSREQGMMIEAMLKDDPRLRRAPLGRGEICSIIAADYKSIVLEMLARDPWASSHGEIASYAQIIDEERSRTGVEDHEIDLSNDSAESMIDKIERTDREPMSDGYDAVIGALAKRFGLAIDEYMTGTRIGDLIVPERKIGDLRSFGSMKIARSRPIEPKGARKKIVCDMQRDVRRIVETLSAIERAEDLELVIVPSKEYAILAEGR